MKIHTKIHPYPIVREFERSRERERERERKKEREREREKERKREREREYFLGYAPLRRSTLLYSVPSTYYFIIFFCYFFNIVRTSTGVLRMPLYSPSAQNQKCAQNYTHYFLLIICALMRPFHLLEQNSFYMNLDVKAIPNCLPIC